MSNMMDYLAWRGDVSFAYSPLNEVDALILATLSYPDYPAGDALLRDQPLHCPMPGDNAISFFHESRSLLCAAALTERFAGVNVRDAVSILDDDRDMQFAAVTFSLPDGTHYIAFRGTDSTLIGWREDFNMAFESPVPAQTQAVAYLKEAAARLDGPLRLGGHSKGGNLAVYAAAHMPQEVQQRIVSIHIFDAPGLDDATMASEGYTAIARRIRSFVPQSSVIGLLLAYHPEYTVVKSDGLGLLQHDTFTWQLLGTDFIEATEVDVGSQLVDQTVHSWLSQVEPGQRRVFVDTLFDLLEATGAHTVKELLRDVPDRAAGVLKALQKVDFETARMIGTLMGQFVSIGAQNILELIRQRIQQGTSLPDKTKGDTPDE